MRAQPTTRTSNRASVRTAFFLLATTATALGCAARGPAGASPAPGAQPVSVGYGTQDRREVTSAISSVTACDALAARTARVEEMLQGRVSGVDVIRRSDGGISVRVRGAQSLMGRADPLFVVDGMPLAEATSESALMGIPPQDVQRIDVLKDAAATAIYGSRGMNGVVLITTLRGKRDC